MTAKRRRPHSRSPAAEPMEDDDLLSEILLRLPPQPSSLPRASLVCKRWRRLVSDPGFFRRFRQHHRRNPPLLGLLDRYQCVPFVPTLEAPNRVPPGRFSLQAADADCPTSLGCRHGLVLLHLAKSLQVLVWDPITGDQHRTALPPRFCGKGAMVNGAVLRAAGHAHFQFQVVLVMADDDDNHRRAFACVYLSETGAWGDLVSISIPSEPEVDHGLDWSPTVVNPEAAVLVGDSLHWLLNFGYSVGILEFHLDTHALAVIEVPVDTSEDVAITRAECGGLGCIYLSNFNARLWNRKTDCNGVASWVLRRTIELDKLLCLNVAEERDPLTIIGFAEDSNVALLWTGSLFMIQLESLQFKRLPETNLVACSPFESVYAASK